MTAQCGHRLDNATLQSVPGARKRNGLWQAPCYFIAKRLRSMGIENDGRVRICKACGGPVTLTIGRGLQCDPKQHTVYYDRLEKEGLKND